MTEADDKKIFESMKQELIDSGTVGVTFDCGGDETGVSFRDWISENTSVWSPEKQHMKWELIKRLQLPGPSETSVDGSGTICVVNERIELTYSITDVNYGNLSEEDMCLPVPDVENVLLKTPSDFINFDFEIRFSILRYILPNKWHEARGFYTEPKVSGNAFNKLIKLLEPLIQPHFDQIQKSAADLSMGVINICDLEFEGFYWHATNEMYYTLLLGRERLQGLVKDETITLFEDI